MRRLAFLTFMLIAALAPTAHAGGWATAELSSTPAGASAGEPWNVDITILQHGRTPMEGIEPAVVIRDGAGNQSRFAGEPTAQPGVYRAEVVFPDSGRYSIKVDDGFTNAVAHDFPPVTIGAAAPAAESGGIPWWPFALGAGLLALASALAAAVRRRRGAAAVAA